MPRASDDLFLVEAQERAQHRQLQASIQGAQDLERLRRDLRQRFAGHDGLCAVFARHALRRSVHEALQHQLPHRRLARSANVFHDILERAAKETRPTEKKLGPYLTISRQAGAGAADLASMLASRLGWSVLDKELVDELAGRLEVSPKLLELMDETKSNWLRDTLFNLVESRLVIQDSYVDMLGRVALLAAYDGNVIIVGRGAHFFLPRPLQSRQLHR